MLTRKSRRRRSRFVERDRRQAAWMVAPATFLLLLLVGWPAVQTVVLSLQRVSLVGPSTFIGLDNFVQLFTSEVFVHSLWITTVYAFGFLAISTVLGLLFGLILNERFRGRTVARTILILPWAVPWLVVGIIWRWFADPDVGGLNSVLYTVGVVSQGVPFLADPGLALLLAIVAGSWRQASLSALLVLAALQVIPKELHDSAAVDGAGTFARFRFITLPWLRPTLVVVMITNATLGLLMFDVIYGMTQGGPADATYVLSILLYQELFAYTNIGAGSAVAVVLGLVAFGVGALFLRAFYRSESVLGRPVGVE